MEWPAGQLLSFVQFQSSDRLFGYRRTTLAQDVEEAIVSGHHHYVVSPVDVREVDTHRNDQVVKGAHWPHKSFCASIEPKIVIDRRHQVDAKDVVPGQFVMVDELAVVDIILELLNQPVVDPSVDCTLHLFVPASEAVLHEDAEDLGHAEVRQIEEKLRLA